MASETKLLSKLERDYQPKFFNGTFIEDFLKSNEKKVIIVLRIDENQKAYDNFDKEFSATLAKLPNSPLKNLVGFVFNKKLIFYGTAKNIDGVTYVRDLISKNDKLAGIVLNAYSLDISIKDGNTNSMVDAIYATYYGLIRAAAIIHKQDICRDKELQRQLTTLISILMFKILGRNITITAREKQLIQLICIYLFYRQFLEEKHPRVIKTITKYYTDLFDKGGLEGLESYFDKLKSFDNFRDFPKIVQLFGISGDTNPSQLTMYIIRTLGATGFHTLLGTLDNLLASFVLARYPTDIVSRGFTINSEIQDRIEKKMVEYINKISYEDSFNSIVSKTIKEK